MFPHILRHSFRQIRGRTGSHGESVDSLSGDLNWKRRLRVVFSLASDQRFKGYSREAPQQLEQIQDRAKGEVGTQDDESDLEDEPDRRIARVVRSLCSEEVDQKSRNRSNLGNYCQRWSNTLRQFLDICRLDIPRSGRFMIVEIPCSLAFLRQASLAFPNTTVRRPSSVKVSTHPSNEVKVYDRKGLFPENDIVELKLLLPTQSVGRERTTKRM